VSLAWSHFLDGRLVELLAKSRKKTERAMPIAKVTVAVLEPKKKRQFF